MIQKTLLTFLITLVTFAFSYSAQAQLGSDTKSVRIKKDSASLFPRHFYTVDFFNNPNVSESKFTMRLASHGEVTGCTYMSKPRVDKRMVANYIRFEISDSRIRLKKREPRYSNYDCDITHNESYMDVELDRDELIENGITKLELTHKRYGDFLPAEIDINKYKIEYKVDGPDYTYMRTFWFFPKNSVILMVPSAKQGQDVQEQLKEFARSNGLILMENALEDFELPYNAHHYAFFTDPKKQFTSQLETPGQTINVGQIKTTRTAYNAQGPYKEEISLPVQAMLPGRYGDNR